MCLRAFAHERGGVEPEMRYHQVMSKRSVGDLFFDSKIFTENGWVTSIKFKKLQGNRVDALISIQEIFPEHSWVTFLSVRSSPPQKLLFYQNRFI